MVKSNLRNLKRKVQYSNFSFYLELKEDVTQLYKIDVAFQYACNSIYLAFKYFERSLDLWFIDDKALNEKYGLVYECLSFCYFDKMSINFLTFIRWK